MKLPNFLLIGAMKAGTTTLYEDLKNIEGVYFPPEKEPDDLIFPEVETEEGKKRYSQKFSKAADGAVIGDASTSYSKRPTYEGVAPRALRVLGSDIKIIYMTRDPIKRIVSQYNHSYGLGIEDREIDIAVLEDEKYVSYSQYEWQITPWREIFGDENVLIVPFERYIIEKEVCLKEICEFLGVAPPNKVSNTHRNKSDGKRMLKKGSLLSRFGNSNFYMYKLKPLIPGALRDKFKSILLPKVRKANTAISDNTRQQLLSRLNLNDEN